MSLQEQIFNYIRQLSKETSELYRKDLVHHFVELYGGVSAKNSTHSSVRTQIDMVLRRLCYLGFIHRIIGYHDIAGNKIRGYYCFTGKIPDKLTHKKLYENYKRKINRTKTCRTDKP